MPLTRIDSTTAFESTRSNSQNSWPNRADVGNRVEPIARPGFQPSFTLLPEEGVFTIGSCFARNVEEQLERLGFFVPMRKLKIVENVPDDMENNPNIFNNYAVPSILNELEWAIDPAKPFDPETCLLEVTKGGYCDLHLTRLLRPVPLEEALARRARIKAGMAAVKDCRVIIVTLGLVEAWWDNVARRYLNIAPPKQAAKRYPDRFELHVMSHAEILDHLERVIALLQAHGRPDHRIVLTVSPVPLGQTFTDQDVMVANAYSKAALRSAAQEIWSRYEHVDYYPSYESVTLSDRALAWQDDLRHVTPALIEINVNRMVMAYANAGLDLDGLLRQAQSAEKVRQFAMAETLYGEVAKAEPGSVVARLGLGRCRGELGQVEVAEELLLPLADDPEAGGEALAALARAYRAGGLADRFAGLVPRLEALGDGVALRELILGSFAFGDHDGVRRYCSQFIEKLPRAPLGYEYLGRVAVAEGRWEEAERWLKTCLLHSQALPMVYALLGEAERALGKEAEARDSFERALALNPRTALARKGLAELSAAAAAE